MAGVGSFGLLVAACTEDGGTGASPPTAAATDGATESTAAATTGPTTTGSGVTAAAEAGSTAGPLPDCVLTPGDAEGPFYAELDLVRRDITDGRPGAPLELRITVVDATTCERIEGAEVDVWHADAAGVYSAFTEQGEDGDVDASAESFLRGVQVTDDDGVASFATIYPGWYPGRATHIHVKVILEDRTAVTSQLYFPDEISTIAYRTAAYVDRGDKDTANDEDGLGADDPALRMTVDEVEGRFVATHTIGIA